MEIREAIQMAKEFVAHVYDGDHITDIAFEEHDFDRENRSWKITIGFTHPIHAKNVMETMAVNPWRKPLRRSYKVVSINDENGRIESFRDRFLPIVS